MTKSACLVENARPLGRGSVCVRAPIFCLVHKKKALFEVGRKVLLFGTCAWCN